MITVVTGATLVDGMTRPLRRIDPRARLELLGSAGRAAA
jgi:hypothetical protein